ncbi:MAG: Bsp6I family type II restriction endonuclease [Parcubacteria group bacterium]|jgi:hypothetical protein
MRKGKIIIKIAGKDVRLDILKILKSDRRKLKIIFHLWIKLSKLLRSFGARGINIPEGLTESLFCLEMGSVRVLKAHGTKGSFDTIDLKSSKRQQIKASSSRGPTSFGPRSFWDEDELYWMDFFRNGEVDGTFDIYKISDKYIYTSSVNKDERLSDQQDQKRRPRIDFKGEIIERNKLKPIKENCKV